MGRTLKRVPLDFSWPFNTVWGGYVNPYYHQSTGCTACGETGLSPTARHLKDQWYGNAPFEPEERGSVPFEPDNIRIFAMADDNVKRSPSYYGEYGSVAVSREAERLCRLFNGSWSHHLNQDDVNALVAEGRLYEFTSTYVKGTGWVLKDPPYIPTAKEVNEWSLSGFGHDSSNQWVVVHAECVRLQVPYECSVCQGEGRLWPTPEIKELYENFEWTGPPVGAGYQLWETTTEGSPQSPVFTDFNELCEWCAVNATTFGSHKASVEEWKQMLGDGLVCHQEGNMVFI